VVQPARCSLRIVAVVGFSCAVCGDVSDDACAEWTYVEESRVSAAAETGRRIVRQDSRSIQDLTASVASLVRAFRRDRHFSLGESTARLVRSICYTAFLEQRPMPSPVALAHSKSSSREVRTHRRPETT
jgi:hypothetical protein